MGGDATEASPPQERGRAQHVGVHGAGGGDGVLDAQADAERVAGMGSWTWDLGSGGFRWSPELCRLLGGPPGGDARMPDAYIARVHEEDQGRVAAILSQVQDKGGAFAFEHRSHDPDGNPRFLQARGQVDVEGAHGSTRIVGVALDITDRRQREEAELRLRRQRHAAERLRELHRLKVRFLDRAAHEFSTPLTPLRIQAEMLAAGHMGRLTRVQEDAVASISRNVERLAGLVEAVRDVASLEDGGFMLDLRRVDLAGLAAVAVEGVRPSAQARRVDLQLDAPRPVHAEADPDRVGYVLGQLLQNALEATPEGGGVRVRCRRRSHDALIAVQDTGKGVPADRAGLLFTPFAEEDGGASPGRGLGLALCHAVAVEHGGTIWVRSRGDGKGSTFFLTLPLERPPGQRRRDPPAPQALRSWRLVYFKCPACGSRDVDAHLLRNRYECSACAYRWR